MKSTTLARIIFGGFIIGGIFGFFHYVFGVSVTPAKIAQIQNICGVASNTQSTICYRREFRQIITRFNLKEIVQAMEDNDAEQNKNIASVDRFNCHGIAHIAGEIAGQLTFASAPNLIASCGIRCGYGCTHGVVMGVLKKNKALVGHLDSLCQRPDGESLTPSDAIACFHGLGHGLAEYTGYRIPSAVGYCESLSKRGSKDECMTGVFMEVYSPADSNHEPIPLPQPLFSPCAKLHGVSLSFCKRMMITTLYRVNKEIISAYQLCQSEFRQEMQTCVFTIGADVYFQEQENVEQIIRACGKMGLYSTPCLHGAVMSSIAIHQNTLQAKEICRHLGVDGEGACVSYANARLDELHIQTR